MIKTILEAHATQNALSAKAPFNVHGLEQNGLAPCLTRQNARDLGLFLASLSPSGSTSTCRLMHAICTMESVYEGDWGLLKIAKIGDAAKILDRNLNHLKDSDNPEQSFLEIFLEIPMWFDLESDNADDAFREPLERNKTIKKIIFDAFKEYNSLTGAFKFDIKRFIILSCMSSAGDFDKSFKKI